MDLCLNQPHLFHCIYVVTVTTVVMAALWNKAGHYIFALWFLLLSSFFPRLILAVTEKMSTILLHMVWP